MPKKRKKPPPSGYFQLTHYLEDEVEKAAWKQARKRMNGHGDFGTFFWPPKVRSQYKRLEKAVDSVRRTNCGCSKKAKKNSHGLECKRAKRRAKKILTKLRVRKVHRDKIVDALAILAHTKSP